MPWGVLRKCHTQSHTCTHHTRPRTRAYHACSRTRTHHTHTCTRAIRAQTGYIRNPSPSSPRRCLCHIHFPLTSPTFPTSHVSSNWPVSCRTAFFTQKRNLYNIPRKESQHGLCFDGTRDIKPRSLVWRGAEATGARMLGVCRDEGNSSGMTSHRNRRGGR